MTIDNADALVGIAVGITALMAVVVGWLRWVRPRWKKLHQLGGRAIATLVGTEEIRHKVTGKVIVKAQPGVGVQVAELQQTVSELVKQDHRLGHVENAVSDHERRISDLEKGRVERVATQIENAAMWQGVSELRDDDKPDQ